MNSPTKSLLRTVVAALAAAPLLTLSSCTQSQAEGAGIGALAGGALGAIAGDDSSDAIRGAAIGAAAGAGVAALKEQNDRKRASQQTAGVRYKKGYKTKNPYQVISPFPPNNLIDISRNPKTGKPFQSGDLARDPSNKQIFRIP